MPRRTGRETRRRPTRHARTHRVCGQRPGNQYIWNGVAAGVVTVIGRPHFGGEQVFRESVSVRFPDQDGISAEQVPGQAVAQALVRRLSERVAWMFYDHEEPKAIKY